MFGYVKPNKMELKLKEIHRYNDLYCGLCYAIRKDYGQIYGCALSYDLTFLLTLLSGVTDDTVKIAFSCPLNPLKKKTVNVSESALHYAAFINYFLIYLKVDDDIIDDNLFWKKVIKKILEKNKKYIVQYNRYVDIANSLKHKMDLFNEKEKNRDSFDELSNAFGDFFAEIFLGYFAGVDAYKNKKDLYGLSFNLGKWIYLMDAYDDYVKDKKRKNFNLITTMYFVEKEPDEDQIQKRVQGIVTILVGNMQKYLKNLSISSDKSIVENVIMYGCGAQYNHILRKRYPHYANKMNI